LQNGASAATETFRPQRAARDSAAVDCDVKSGSAEVIALPEWKAYTGGPAGVHGYTGTLNDEQTVSAGRQGTSGQAREEERAGTREEDAGLCIGEDAASVYGYTGRYEQNSYER